MSGMAAAPLALAAYPGQSNSCVRLAQSAGVNFFFFYSISQASLIDPLGPLLRRSRDDIILATGSGSRRGAGLERVRRSLCRRVGVETLDVFFAEYLSGADDPPTIFGSGGVLDVLSHWRDIGAIRYVGVTTHDRELARLVVDDGRVDVLMHRYNMAHRKAATSLFPAAKAAGVTVVAFTATRWRTLLGGHPDWKGPVPSAADCYRYCLAAPGVEVVLSAPKTPRELRANLVVLDDSPAVATDWSAYGDLIYADGRSRFEERWP